MEHKNDGMDQYREYIKSLAREDKDVVFYNSGPEHAALVLATIFENAHQYVKIYAGGFTGEVSNRQEYREGLQKFLSGGGRLQVILQRIGPESINEPRIFDILRYYSLLNPSQISVKVHPARVTKSDNEVHFTVADDKMYRIENDIDKFTAEGNFNNEPIAKQLSSIFDSIYSRPESEDVPLLRKN